MYQDMRPLTRIHLLTTCAQELIGCDSSLLLARHPSAHYSLNCLSDGLPPDPCIKWSGANCSNSSRIKPKLQVNVSAVVFLCRHCGTGVHRCLHIRSTTPSAKSKGHINAHGVPGDVSCHLPFTLSRFRLHTFGIVLTAIWKTCNNGLTPYPITIIGSDILHNQTALSCSIMQ